MKSALNALVRSKIAVCATLALAAATVSAHATPINVVNGGFESTTNGNGQIGYNTNVTGWTTNGYNFVFAPGTADKGGANGSAGNVQLWGPHNGSANGLKTSPNGGNFLALDGNYGVGAVSQTLTGLTAGDKETVTFDFAGAQQYGFTGPTTEALEVSLGGQTIETPVLQDASHGFTGWQTENFTFTATGTSEVLSFLAVGTPSGVPPMSLLDGVSVSQQSPVPEPGTISLMLTGIAGIGGLVRSRFKKA